MPRVPSRLAAAPETLRLRKMHRSHVCYRQKWSEQEPQPRPLPTAYRAPEDAALRQRQLRGVQVCPCCGGVRAPPDIHAKVHTDCRRPLLRSPCTGSVQCPCCAAHVQQQDPLAGCIGLQGCYGHQSRASPKAVLNMATESAPHAHAVLRSGFSCPPDGRQAPPGIALPPPDSKGLGLRVRACFSPWKADAQGVLHLWRLVPVSGCYECHMAPETIEESRHEPGVT